MNISPEYADDLIRLRRSIYPAQYSGEIIDDSIIQKMLENANWAPSHKLTEPWRFRVFKGNGLQLLANFQSELYKQVTENLGNYNDEKYEKLRTKPLLCSHIISIGMKRNPVVPETEEIAAVACSVQNMYLTAAANGVGCYWGSGGITYYEKALPFFGLDKQDKLLGFLFCGIPKKWPSTGRRNPIEDKVEWITG
jgi:nitroreductase